MPNTLKIKRGLASSIPQGQLAEPLFTTDTYDLYIGKGSGGNQRIQNYIASGTTNDILRGDGSVYTFPLGISSPSAGQVLKYNGTSWVNDSDAGITGTGTTNTLPKFTGATTLGNSNVTDSGTLITLGSNSYVNGSLGIGTTSLTDSILKITRNITGASGFYAVDVSASVQSDVVTSYTFRSQPSTQAAAFSTDLIGFFATQGTTGAGSTITSHTGVFINNLNAGSVYGVRVLSSNTGTSTAQAFRGDLAAGTNVWNLYMNGTANNYMAGALGIGSTSVGSGINLNMAKTMTGATTQWNINNQSQVQSDVTLYAAYYRTNAATQAATFTLTDLVHYATNQGTFGAGSTITNQYGFVASGTMVNATNNYGFYGSIAAGTNRWNLYMNGTANNYLAGSLGIGTTSLSNTVLRISKNITGNASSYAIRQEGTIQQDVTSDSIGVWNTLHTQAATFTLPSYVHFNANQGTIGAGNIVTNQYGFVVNSNVTGATNNYGFYGNIAAGTNRWNLYMNGTANNYMAGSLGIGSTSLTGVNLRIEKAITGGTTSYSIRQQGTVQSDVTTLAIGIQNTSNISASAFTLSEYAHYQALQGTFGAGSTVTNQYGFVVANNLTGATNNYGFYGNLAAATGVWNLYMNGTANNFMAGSLGIGSTSLSIFGLRLSKTITGGTIAYGQFADGAIQSDVTSEAMYYSTNATTAASAFTLTNLFHFRARYNTFGATSAVTNQYGFYVDSALTAATNNFGFYGNIPSGTNRWNLYMNGTAANYLAGDLYIGTTSATATFFRVNGSKTASSAIARGALIDTTLVAAANSDVLVGLDINPTFTNGAFTGVKNIGLRVAGDMAFTGANYIYFNGYGFGSNIYSDGYSIDNNLRQTTKRFRIATGNNRVDFIPQTTTSWDINFTGDSGAATTTTNVVLKNNQTTFGQWFTTGNWFIGASPSDAGYKLDVNGTARVQSTLTVGANALISTEQAIISNSASQQLRLYNSSSAAGSQAQLTLTTQSNGYVSSAIAAIALDNSSNQTLSFSTPNAGTVTENLRIWNNGNITIRNGGTYTDGGQKLQIVPTNNQTGISISGSSLTGTNAQSLLDLSQTWNTTGYPTAIKLNITNTASGILANLMDLQVGGATQFLVDKAGAIKTSAPSGGTAGKWKLGSKVTATVALVTTDYIELEVDGVAYKVGLVS